MELGWFNPPLITLPMKFRYGGVRVYFRLRLGALSAGVEVESITAEDEAAGGDLNLRLESALRTARVRRAVAETPDNEASGKPCPALNQTAGRPE